MSASSHVPPPPVPDRFEQIQRFISRTKIILVEIASTIGLIVLLYQGLKLELKW